VGSNSSESIAATAEKSEGVAEENRKRKEQSGINHEISTRKQDISTRIDQSSSTGAACFPTDAERLEDSKGQSIRRMKSALRPGQKERKANDEKKRAEGFYRGGEVDDQIAEGGEVDDQIAEGGEVNGQIAEGGEVNGQIAEEDEVDDQIAEEDEIDNWNMADL